MHLDAVAPVARRLGPDAVLQLGEALLALRALGGVRVGRRQ